MTKPKSVAELIEALPMNGRIYVDAGGRGQIETALTTAKLKVLAREHGEMLAALRELVESGKDGDDETR